MKYVSVVQRFMGDFSIEGVHQMFWGTIFEGRNEILLLGKALKFGVIFQKYALKLIKIWKIIENIREKMQISPNFLIFWRNYGVIRNIISLGYNGGSGAEKFSRNLSKFVMHLPKISWFLRRFDQKYKNLKILSDRGG